MLHQFCGFDRVMTVMLHRLLEGIYMPHGYCLLWEPWLIGLHAVSDVLTFAAYSAIPVAIWIFVSRRRDLEMKGLARLFAAFILWCGLTHLFGLITLWHPVYELQGVVKAITAGVSVTTAVMIFPLIPKALAVPSPRELKMVNSRLEGEIASHRRTLDELEQARAELERRVAERTSELEQATERFKLLFEHAPVAMIMVGRDGKVEQVNAAALTLFGADREALIDASVEMLLPEASREGHPELRRAYSASPKARPMGGGRELHARRFAGEEFPVEIGLNPLPGERHSVIASIIDISSRRKEEERMQIVMRELSHRSKNLLAVIQGMARQAIASSPSLADFEQSFRERLQGLSRSHDLLVGKSWAGASIRELVRAQLAIADRADSAALVVEGPEVVLSPEATQTLGLALHELLTNALKHGAFSRDDGKVRVSWEIFEQGGERNLRFEWRETVATVLGAPVRTGFGRTVLERVVPQSLRGKASVEFARDGLRWTLVAPLSTLTGELRYRDPVRVKGVG